jgi:hypothetical protein
VETNRKADRYVRYGTDRKVQSKVRQWTLTQDTFLHKNLCGAAVLFILTKKSFEVRRDLMEAFILVIHSVCRRSLTKWR